MVISSLLGIAICFGCGVYVYVCDSDLYQKLDTRMWFHPCTSNRQHYEIDNCLEDYREDY